MECSSLSLALFCVTFFKFHSTLNLKCISQPHPDNYDSLPIETRSTDPDTFYRLPKNSWKLHLNLKVGKVLQSAKRGPCSFE
jgi:hypothetical protein